MITDAPAKGISAGQMIVVSRKCAVDTARPLCDETSISDAGGVFFYVIWPIGRKVGLPRWKIEECGWDWGSIAPSLFRCRLEEHLVITAKCVRDVTANCLCDDERFTPGRWAKRFIDAPRLWSSHEAFAPREQRGTISGGCNCRLQLKV